MTSGNPDGDSGLQLIKTLRDALDALSNALNKLSRSQQQPQMLWWRGQAKSTWDLIPTVFRDRDPCDEEIYRRETILAMSFLAQAPVRYRDWPGGETNYARWLLLMQHYGLATRLLDWTESLLVALYFAVNQKPTEAGRLWALNPS